MQSDTMRLSPIQRQAEEEREASWLRAVEAGDTTVPDLMAITGLGRSQIYERLKRARENRGETQPEDEDLPYLSLTEAPEAERGEWYDLRDDRTSLDGTTRRRARVAAGRHVRVRSLVSGVLTPEPIKQHQPDPDGLKGGVG